MTLTIDLLLYIIIGIAIICTGFTCFVTVQLLGLRRQFDEVEEYYKRARRESAIVRKSLYQMGMRVQRVEKPVAQILQDRHDFKKKQKASFDKALKLAKSGADKDKIMKECKINAAQADVVLKAGKSGSH